MLCNELKRGKDFDEATLKCTLQKQLMYNRVTSTIYFSIKSGSIKKQ